MADQQAQKAATVEASSRQGTASPIPALSSASHAVQSLAPLPEDGEQLEADFDERDSTYGDGYSDTTSLRSSILSGVVEHGRRYQAVRDNPLNFASDDKQFESMEAGHMAYTIIESQQQNPYFRAPISKNAQHILDLGAGRGDWCIGVSDRFPELTVHGVDLYPPPASWVPPNCILEVDDFTKSFTWGHAFDLIHLRMLCGALPAAEWTKLYKRAYDNLAPGGWIEHVDVQMDMLCDDGSLPADSLLAKWRSEMGALAEATGNSISITDFMRKGIVDAGFVNIHERQFKFPLGDWPKHPVFKEAGECNRIHFKEGLEGWVIYALSQIGWSKEEVTVYVAKMRQELDANYHIYQLNKRIWAQKPMDAVAKAE